LNPIHTEILNTVDTIADDVARWSGSQRSQEYVIKKVPIHLVLPPLAKKLGDDFLAIGTEGTIVVRRRAVRQLA
jgi:hypothetical protein